MTTRRLRPDLDPSVESRGPLTAAATTVREVMLARPKTLRCDASLHLARAALTNERVPMVLLTDGSRLVGTLIATDLPPSEVSGRALIWSTLGGRTVSPDVPVASAHGLLVERGMRRLAVVDDQGDLLGLLCLKRRKNDFCSDADVAERAQSRSATWER